MGRAPRIPDANDVCACPHVGGPPSESTISMMDSQCVAICGSITTNHSQHAATLRSVVCDCNHAPPAGTALLRDTTSDTVSGRARTTNVPCATAGCAPDGTAWLSRQQGPRASVCAARGRLLYLDNRRQCCLFVIFARLCRVVVGASPKIPFAVTTAALLRASPLRVHGARSACCCADGTKTQRVRLHGTPLPCRRRAVLVLARRVNGHRAALGEVNTRQSQSRPHAYKTPCCGQRSTSVACAALSRRSTAPLHRH